MTVGSNGTDIKQPFFAASLEKSLIQEDGVECAVDQAEQGKCVCCVWDCMYE